MTFRLVIVEPAEIDVDEIFTYIFVRSPQGAASLYRAFLACTKRMILQPLACSIAPENVRRLTTFTRNLGTPRF